jgi:hypothetical protein
MCEWITYKDKGIESKYELYPSGTCSLPGKDCPICKAWNEQFNRKPEMFTKAIGDWKLDDDIQKQMGKEEIKKYNENMKGEAERIKENNDKLKGVWKGEKY